MKVIKRDGKTVEFDKKKIKEAVIKAMKNGSGIYLPDIAKLIANDAQKHFQSQDETPTIYMIETFVYDDLGRELGTEYTVVDTINNIVHKESEKAIILNNIPYFQYKLIEIKN